VPCGTSWLVDDCKFLLEKGILRDFRPKEALRIFFVPAALRGWLMVCKILLETRGK